MRGSAQLSFGWGRTAGELRELSLGGAFVAGVRELDPGTRLSAWVILPNELAPMRIPARVLYARKGSSFSAGGVGIEFERVCDDERQRIARSVERSNLLYTALLFRLQNPTSRREEVERACLEAGVPLGLTLPEVEERVSDALRRYRGER